MTRLSNYLLPTLKDAPADAEADADELIVRAGDSPAEPAKGSFRADGDSPPERG